MGPGVIHMAIATVLFFLMGICVKSLPAIPVSEIVLFRAVIALVIGYAMIRSKNISLFGTHKKLRNDPGGNFADYSRGDPQYYLPGSRAA
jgi:hypothetical protein